MLRLPARQAIHREMARRRSPQSALCCSHSVNLVMGPPSPTHSAWSILEGYDLDCLSPFELGASTSTYPPQISANYCRPFLPPYFGSVFSLYEISTTLLKPATSLHRCLHWYISSLINLAFLTSYSYSYWHSSPAFYSAYIVLRLLSARVDVLVYN